MIQNFARLRQVNVKFLKFLKRDLATKVEKEQSKTIKYTSSINLPKTLFPTRLNPQQRTETEKAVRTVS